MTSHEEAFPHTLWIPHHSILLRTDQKLEFTVCSYHWKIITSQNQKQKCIHTNSILFRKRLGSQLRCDNIFPDVYCLSTCIFDLDRHSFLRGESVKISLTKFSIFIVKQMSGLAKFSIKRDLNMPNFQLWKELATAKI